MSQEELHQPNQGTNPIIKEPFTRDPSLFPDIYDEYIKGTADGPEFIGFDKAEGAVVLSRMIEAARRVAGKDLDFKFSSGAFSDGRSIGLHYNASIGEIDPVEVANAGVSVEFAGPTSRKEGSHILPGFKPDIITNIGIEPPYIRPNTEIDALADATNMPIGNNSIGSVHISCLPRGTLEQIRIGNPIRERAISEAVRVIKEGGYLVWDGGIISDYDFIVKNGLVPKKSAFKIGMVQENDNSYYAPVLTVNGVFQKPMTQVAGGNQ